MTAVKQQLPTMSLLPPSMVFKYDRTNTGWELVEDIPLTGESVLNLSGFFKDGEECVKGDIMLERGRAMVNELGWLAGQHHAEALLDQQDRVPIEWQGCHLVFAGTIWLDPYDRRYVPYLFSSWGRWNMDFHCLHAYYWICDHDRLVHFSRVV